MGAGRPAARVLPVGDERILPRAGDERILPAARRGWTAGGGVTKRSGGDACQSRHERTTEGRRPEAE